MAKIKVEIKGVKRIKQLFNKLKVRFMDLSPVWPSIRREFFKVEEKRFATSNKSRWRPLNPNYERLKSKMYPGKPIMEASGKLKKSLTSPTGEAIYRPLKRSVAFGTSVQYALAQHFGTKERGSGRGQSRLPPRPLIGLLKTDIKRFRIIMDQYINTMVGKLR